MFTKRRLALNLKRKLFLRLASILSRTKIKATNYLI